MNASGAPNSDRARPVRLRPFFIAGQPGGSALFSIRTAAFSADFQATEITLRLRGSAMRIRFQGANRAARVAGLDPMDAKLTYLFDNLRADLRGFLGVAYYRLYPGIDAAYRTTEAGLKSEFIVHPGAEVAWVWLL